MSHYAVAVITRSRQNPKTLLGKHGGRNKRNPKWDWYEVGGSWSDYLKASTGKRGILLDTSYQKGRKVGYYDSAKIKDIDFSPNKEEYNKAIRFWEVVIENSPLKSDEKQEDFLPYYSVSYYLQRYGTKEQYAKEESLVHTYAVITPDGQWHSIGEMGYFGCGSESYEDRRKWVNEWYNNFIKNRDGNESVTIFDCHI